MVDCSHGNSAKQHARQIVVAQDIANQLATKSTPLLVSSGEFLIGIMVESNLVEGRQNIVFGQEGLVYGQSVTGIFLLT